MDFIVKQIIFFFILVVGIGDCVLVGTGKNVTLIFNHTTISPNSISCIFKGNEVFTFGSSGDVRNPGTFNRNLKDRTSVTYKPSSFSLIISNVTDEDDGMYTCDITSTSSQEAVSVTLTSYTQSNITITVQPESHNNVVMQYINETVLFDIKSSCSKPPVIIIITSKDGTINVTGNNSPCNNNKMNYGISTLQDHVVVRGDMIMNIITIHPSQNESTTFSITAKNLCDKKPCPKGMSCNGTTTKYTCEREKVKPGKNNMKMIGIIIGTVLAVLVLALIAFVIYKKLKGNKDGATGSPEEMRPMKK